MWKGSPIIVVVLLYLGQTAQADYYTNAALQDQTRSVEHAIEPEIPRVTAMRNTRILKSFLLKLLEEFSSFANNILLPDLSFRVGPLTVHASKGQLLNLVRSLMNSVGRFVGHGGRGYRQQVNLSSVRVFYDRFVIKFGGTEIIRKLKLTLKENWLKLMVSMQRRLQCPLQFNLRRIVDNPLKAEVEECRFCPLVIQRMIEGAMEKIVHLFWDPIRTVIFWVFGLLNNTRGWVCFKRSIHLPEILIPTMKRDSLGSGSLSPDQNQRNPRIHQERRRQVDLNPPASFAEEHPYTMLPKKDSQHSKPQDRHHTQVYVNPRPSLTEEHPYTTLPKKVWQHFTLQPVRHRRGDIYSSSATSEESINLQRKSKLPVPKKKPHPQPLDELEDLSYLSLIESEETQLPIFSEFFTNTIERYPEPEVESQPVNFPILKLKQTPALMQRSPRHFIYNLTDGTKQFRKVYSSPWLPRII